MDFQESRIKNHDSYFIIHDSSKMLLYPKFKPNCRKY